ncbi:FixH family protein [Blattabacterium cuenoti]|uniref:FixH family protein n=1 Tax=Blattabacterium cuenoti TaxID=1653831 RepID=UPI00163B8091|nr:FixH family protein [Blattabacterium cuenoti]
MRIKFSWEVGIILSLFTFIIFVTYIAFFFPNVNSQLISDKYYEEELKYQEIINEKKNVFKLSKEVRVFIFSSGVTIIFTHSFNENIHGIFTLLRSSSKNLDVTQPFQMSKYSSKKLFIPKIFLKKGYYKLIIRWTSEQSRFFFEKDLFWKS